jgi:hypothetical protein
MGQSSTARLDTVVRHHVGEALPVGVLPVVVGRRVHPCLSRLLGEMHLWVGLMGMPKREFDQGFVVRSVDVQAMRSFVTPSCTPLSWAFERSSSRPTTAL